MKIRNLLTATILSLTLTISAFAGEMQLPGYTTPPPCTTDINSDCTQNQTAGEMQLPGITAAEPESLDAETVVVVGLIGIRATLKLF
jgi:type 1 fimbria pilin